MNTKPLITTDQFVSRLVNIYGDKYDYTKTNFTGWGYKVCATCPRHGDFWRTTYGLLHGYGCPLCRKEELPTVYGVGINDVVRPSKSKAYLAWQQMIERCYGNRIKYKISYQGCVVCEEWLRFSNFKKWFEDPNNGYQDGYSLDKDILIKDNKVYSPDTCCLIPKHLNSIAASGSHNNRKDALPKGVMLLKSGRYRAFFQKKSLGTFSHPEEAFEIYRQKRLSFIKETAENLFKRKEITKKVYDALMNFQIYITD